MQQLLHVRILQRGVLVAALGLFAALSTIAQNLLPTATQTANAMTIGWNLGNTLEATGGETAWGNPLTTQKLIDSVKAAGFNTIRIPCAWDGHANQSTMVIDPTWVARVKQVVDYCVKDNMYVILNIHWDGGWLENNCTQAMQVSVNAKQKSYWTQIANAFKSYDGHLLFASANEPSVSDATGMTVLLSYHQTFINAVRATGGNNSSRTLIVQGPSTDVTKTNQLMNTMPTDNIANRLIVEVHYYPYQFCLMTADASWGNQFYYWGKGNHSTTDVAHSPTSDEQAGLDADFQLMKVKFVDKGIPVIIGEFGAIKRDTLKGAAALALHIASRQYFYTYLAKSARCHGLIPVYWDAGFIGVNSFTLFDRNTTATVDRGAVKALMSGANNCQTVTALEEDATEKNDILLYPNPFNQQLSIKCSGAFKYSTFNLDGTTLESGNSAEMVTLGKNYATGTYIVKIQQNETTRVIRVVKE